MKLRSLNAENITYEQIITELPKEFREDALMTWKLTNFDRKAFDANFRTKYFKTFRSHNKYERGNFNCE